MEMGNFFLEEHDTDDNKFWISNITDGESVEFSVAKFEAVVEKFFRELKKFEEGRNPRTFKFHFSDGVESHNLELPSCPKAWAIMRFLKEALILFNSWEVK